MANPSFTCTLEAWRSGTTLYGRMHYYRSGSYYYQDTTFPTPTMDLGGTTYSDTAFRDRVRAGVYVGDIYSTTFSRTVAGSGNRTVTWTAGSGSRSDFAGTWSETVYFPEQYSPPTGLSVSLVEPYYNGAKFNVSVSSYGNPSSASGRYIEAGILAQNSYGATYKFKAAQNVSSAAIIVNNDTSYSGGALDIQPNTSYYYGAYASNTQRNTSKVQGQFVTLATPPTITYEIHQTSVDINYSVSADGGVYDTDVEYSIDGGNTWVKIDTITGGAGATGATTISNLDPNTDYVILLRTNTTAGASLSDPIVITREHGLYGSYNEKARRITKLYGSSSNQSVVINKLYGPVNGESKIILQSFGHLNYD